MKTVIFYSSTYNGNTLKIAESIAATLSADLIAIETKISDFDLSQYDLIGIGSAIHFGQHAIRFNGSFQHCLYKEKTYSYFPPAVVRFWAITTEH